MKISQRHQKIQSLHQYFANSLGKTDLVLVTQIRFLRWLDTTTIVNDQKNRPLFSQLSHYDRLLIDRANFLQKLLCSFPKNRNQMSFKDNLPLQKLSCGIISAIQMRVLDVKLTDEDKTLIN